MSRQRIQIQPPIPNNPQFLVNRVLLWTLALPSESSPLSSHPIPSQPNPVFPCLHSSHVDKTIPTKHTLSKLIIGFQKWLPCLWKYRMPTLPKYPGWYLSMFVRWWCWPPARPRPPGCLRCLPTRPYPAETWPRLVLSRQYLYISLWELNGEIEVVLALRCLENCWLFGVALEEDVVHHQHSKRLQRAQSRIDNRTIRRGRNGGKTYCLRVLLKWVGIFLLDVVPLRLVRLS